MIYTLNLTENGLYKYLCIESDQKGGVEIFSQGIEIFRGV